MSADRFLKFLAGLLLGGIIALLVISFYSFYPRYLGRLDQGLPIAMHAHAALLLLWTLLTGAQAYFIIADRRDLHRMTGKMSFVVAPIVVASIIAMIPYAYHRVFHELSESAPSLPADEILIATRAAMVIPFYSLAGFVIFYPLAIYHRKTGSAHGTFMLGVALILVNPVTDRLVGYSAYLADVQLPFNEGVAGFLLSDAAMLWAWLQARKNIQPTAPTLMVLTYLLCAQAFVLWGPRNSLWQGLMAWLFLNR